MKIRLSKVQRNCLYALESLSTPGHYVHIRTVAEYVGTTSQEAQRNVYALAHTGLTMYHSSDNGYCITKKGQLLVKELTI